jgi:ribonuclease-3
VDKAPAILAGLQAALSFEFKDLEFLELALVHSSYANEHADLFPESNERLEFLGDAVLDLVVTENLYRRFQKKREGDLTQIKSLLVSKVILAQKGRDLGLGDYLYLSNEEDLAGGRDRTSIIGDAFEALLGAIYMDGGLKAAERFIQRTLLFNAKEIISNGEYLNFKSLLLEHTQSEGQGHPRYLVNSEEGPDHRKVFTVEVVIGGDRMGLGRGRSKKEAQQMAAKEALKELGIS